MFCSPPPRQAGLMPCYTISRSILPHVRLVLLGDLQFQKFKTCDGQIVHLGSPNMLPMPEALFVKAVAEDFEDLKRLYVAKIKGK